MNWLGRIWFPLAAVALTILALPGFVLFGLWITGLEFSLGSTVVSFNALNSWLEDRMRLSFHISLPEAAAVVLFALPFVLILLYFLKLKRKPVQVSSTFLWKKSVEDLHVNSLFQWLRRNVLLLLQILAVLGLIYSVLAPKFFSRGGEGRRYVILVDNSSSMSATDVAPNRLEQAKEQAIAEIEAAGESDAGMVIAFNSAAEIRQSFSTNKIALRKAVADIQTTQRATRLDEALALAESLANPARSTEDAAVRPEGSPRTYVSNADLDEASKTAVHLFSDGRFADAPDFAQGNLRIRFHSIGKLGPEVNNVGIVAFSAARDEFDPSRLFVAVRVLNFRNKSAAIKLELQVFTNGKLNKAYDKAAQLKARIVEVPPAGSTLPAKDVPGEANLTFDVPDVDDRQETVMQARLAGNSDEYPADDEAYLVVGVIRKAAVLVAGPPNPILDAFFDDPATRIVCTLTKITKEQLSDKSKYLDPAQRGDFDLVIFDRCAPAREEDLPQANTLFIGRPPPPWKMPGEPQSDGKTVERVSQPSIKGWTNQSSLLRYLTGLHEVGLFEAYRVNGLPPRTPKLIEGDRDLLLMFSLSRGPYSDTVMAFPILNDVGEWNTNWPLLPSFPLFLRNVLYTLGNIRDAAAEENVPPGDVKTLRPGAGIDKMEVVPPSGSAVTLERGTRADFAFSATDQPGVYAAKWNGGGRRFAVNLLDPDESNLQPRTSVTVGSETLAAGAPDKQPRELWKWLAFGALIVVLVEWYVYNRRVFV